MTRLLEDSSPAAAVAPPPRRVIWIAVLIGVAIVALLAVRLVQAVNTKKSVTNKLEIGRAHV